MSANKGFFLFLKIYRLLLTPYLVVKIYFFYFLSLLPYGKTTKTVDGGVFLDLLEKIYVINLKESKDRKAHMVSEFKKLGFSNYEFFEAVSQIDKIIDQSLKSNFVIFDKYCFRCHKKNCHHTNRRLSRSQIANFFSFVRLMEIISQADHSRLFMICEDDLDFEDSFKLVLNKLINDTSFSRRGIDVDKPLLIRFSNFDPVHKLKIVPPHLSKIKLVSNPCFIVNKYYAQAFLRHLTHIDTTSDHFIHKILLTKEEIQDFSIIPVICFDLSLRVKKFRSTIEKLRN